MNLSGENQITDGHMHAWCLYEKISWRHFIYLLMSIAVCGIWRYKSLTTHLPLELQHKVYPDTAPAKRLVHWGLALAKTFKIKLYWENSPLLNYGVWDLKHGPTEWNLVPGNIPLCLDTGHLMLGARSEEEARQRILSVFRDRASQIGHLHIHENDLVHDLHRLSLKIITPELLEEITKNRTYIYEK